MFYLLTGLAWPGLHWLCMHEVEGGRRGERDVMKVPTYIRIYATAPKNEWVVRARANARGWPSYDMNPLRLPARLAASDPSTTTSR